jgi:glycosyltransferase involved in cell wall biosynthesis
MENLQLDAGLSIIIPFYNEGQNTRKSVDFALDALEEIGAPWEIIVVNDGSNDGISRTDFPTTVKYLEHEHSGRFKTRYLGLIESKYPNILFIDARVWLDRKSLKNLTILLAENPTSKYWNGYINTNNKELAIVSIWETLVMIGWKRGFSQSETIHFGLAEFDRYPKGTTLFLAPKEDFIEAFQKLESFQQKASPVSDDTKLLRLLSENGDIWINRKFSAEYQPRTTFSKFLRNAFYRGQTFVDSYWESPTIFGKLVKFSLPLGITLLSTSIFFGGLKSGGILAMGTVLLSSACLFLHSFNCWKRLPRACKESAVAIPLLFFFGAGFVKAYLLGFLSRLNL